MSMEEYPIPSLCDLPESTHSSSPSGFSREISVEDAKLSKGKEEERNSDDNSSIISSSTSSEFEFCSVVGLQGSPEFVSADELFANGKLRPLLTATKAQSSRNLIPPASICASPRCASMSIEGARSAVLPSRASSYSVQNSRCSSPSRPSKISANPPSAPLTAKPLPTARARLKDFFRSKKGTLKDASQSQSHSRSFWPFSRSNSAGESKSSTPPVTLPPRSNSAGGSGGDRDSVKKPIPIRDLISKHRLESTGFVPSPIAGLPSGGLNVAPSQLDITIVPDNSLSQPDLRMCSNPFIPKDLDMVSNPSMQHNLGLCSNPSTRQDLSLDSNLSTQHDLGMSSNPLTQHNLGVGSNLPAKGRAQNADAARMIRATRSRGSGNSARLAARGIGSPAKSFGRVSPGRRGVWNGLARRPPPGNGKVILRNLERCSAGRLQTKIGCRGGPERPNSHSTSANVAPILNVPSCIGPPFRTAKNRLIFNIPSLFVKKDKNIAASPTNNWRNGA